MSTYQLLSYFIIPVVHLSLVSFIPYIKSSMYFLLGVDKWGLVTLISVDDSEIG